MISVDTQRILVTLRDLGAGIVQASAFALRDTIKAAYDDAKGTTLWHDRTGATRQSINATYTSRTGRVTAGGVAKLLENGTRAHQIRATRARVLRFTQNGTTVFRKRVWHPGTTARPFMRHARDYAQKVADYAADYYLRFALEKAAA